MIERATCNTARYTLGRQAKERGDKASRPNTGSDFVDNRVPCKGKSSEGFDRKVGIGNLNYTANLSNYVEPSQAA